MLIFNKKEATKKLNEYLNKYYNILVCNVIYTKIVWII